MRTHPYLRLALANLAASVVFLVVAMAILEAFCRIRLDDGMRYEFEMWRYATELKMASPDPEIAFTHRPNSHARVMGADVRIDAKGFRDDRQIATDKPRDTVRIVMLGDSVTFGFGVGLDETTSWILEHDLNSHAVERRFEVVNAGVGNYNTTMEVAAYLANQRSLNPDLVVLNFFVNDAEPTPEVGGNPLTRHSLAAIYLSNRFDSVTRWAHGAPGWEQYYRDLYLDDRPAWQRAKSAMRTLEDACDRQHATLVLVNYPDLHQTFDYPLRAVDDQIHRTAVGLRIPFLDLLPAVAGEREPSRLWVHPSDPHPNGTVNHRYARRIAEWLRETILPRLSASS